MNRMIKRAKYKLARVGSATKGAVVAVGAMVGASSANAAITIDETGIHGSIDTVYYLTAVGIVVTFLAVALSIGYGVRALRKG